MQRKWLQTNRLYLITLTTFYSLNTNSRLAFGPSKLVKKKWRAMGIVRHAMTIVRHSMSVVRHAMSIVWQTMTIVRYAMYVVRQTIGIVRHAAAIVCHATGVARQTIVLNMQLRRENRQLIALHS